METENTALTTQAEPHSVETFISVAIDKGLPVETMERLFALRKEVKAEQAREAFTRALAQFQADCPTIEKTKVVLDKYGKERYKYAPIDKIAEQIKTPLKDAGLSFTTDVINEEGFMTAVVKVTHTMGHSETSSFRVPIDKDAYMSAPQRYAAALTFAKRYAFCNALGILTGDEDTDAVEEPAATTPPRVAAPRPAAPAPKPIDPTLLPHYEAALRKQATLDDLAAQWNEIPQEYKSHLSHVKDELKATLQYVG